MSFAFDARRGLILVRAELHGPAGKAVLSLALDTGATSTMVSQIRLRQLGYDFSIVKERVKITTGSGGALVPRLEVSKLMALGRERADFSLLAHTLPSSVTVDGLLGLDFLRGRTLTLDFVGGRALLN